MKRAWIIAAVLVVLAAGLFLANRFCGGQWQGVDEAVVGKYARQAGREASRPLIDPGEGDLLLFLFLLAGTAGGFVAGYYFRGLFGKERTHRGER